MILKPIIPVWIMALICLTLLIFVAYDKQFQEKGDKEFEKLTKNFENMAKKYGNIVKISFLFDKGNLLGYKDAPIDRGPEVFLQLFKTRIFLDEKNV